MKLILNSNKLGITKDILATKVIPFLVPLSIENGLSLNQYNTVVMLIHEMLSKIEEEHQAKLQQLDSIKVQQDSFFQQQTNENGIKNFSTNSDPFDLSSNDQSATSVPIPQNKNLSLEDKERIANQQEQLKRLNNEQPLFPQTKPNFSTLNTHNNNSQAKDLTSTLINANLNMFPSNNVASKPMTSSTFTSKPQSRINTDVFDSLVTSNINGRVQPQSLNALSKNSSNNSNQFNSLTMSMNSQPFVNLNTKNSNPNQSTKQLSKTELEEFLN